VHPGAINKLDLCLLSPRFFRTAKKKTARFSSRRSIPFLFPRISYFDFRVSLLLFASVARPFLDVQLGAINRLVFYRANERRNVGFPGVTYGAPGRRSG
jgi:hypothetical protein